MSFFFTDQDRISRVTGRRKKKKQVVEISDSSIGKLRDLGCNACTLNKAILKNPKFEPIGSSTPLVYVLGSFPTVTEDRMGDLNINSPGRLLHNELYKLIPSSRVREWAIVRCNPEQRPTVSKLEIECCRRFVEADIAKTKPKVIVGLGTLPLVWIQGKTHYGNITKWRGKPFPVVVEGHSCWYLPVEDPAALIKLRKEKFKRIEKHPSEETFKLDLRLLDRYLDTPVTWVQQEGFLDNCEFVLGSNSGDINTIVTWLDELLKLDAVAVDIEANCLRPYKHGSELITIAIGNYEKCYSFPVDKKDGFRTVKSRRIVNNLVKDFLYNKDVIKICQNLKFEQGWFSYKYGRELLRATKWQDTMTMAYALDERKRVHSLEFLSLQYLGFNLKALSKHNSGDIWQWPLERILPYNAMDSKYTFKLFEFLRDELDRTENERLNEVNEFHLALSSTLVHTEDRGMYADSGEVENLKIDLDKQIKDIELRFNEIHEVKVCRRKYGRYDPASSIHNIFILKDLYEVEEVVQWDGKNSTNESVLSAVKDEIEFADLLLQYRGLTKLKSTYVDSIEGYTYPDGKIHTNYNHTFTSTGRLSSDDPNAQNWPSRKYRYVRKLIKPKPGHLIASFDYGQIDARNIAMASEDEYYINALWEGLDIHQDWTERIIDRYPRKLDEMAPIYGIDRDDEEKLIKRYRKDVKNVWTFPLFYGSSVSAAAYHTKLPSEVVEPLFDEFWDTFDGVKKWIDRTVKFYLKHGYVETLNGRRRHGPMKKEELVNATIQGTSAEIVGDAMTRCSKRAFPESFNGRVWYPNEQWQPFIQIHDDIGFYLPDDDNFESIALSIARVLCDVPFDWISVPIVVELQAGVNWYDQTKYVKEYNSVDILN